MNHDRRGPALALALAGAAFVAYPALRPWGSETGLEGAADFASTAWVVSHLLGVAGFALLALALRAATSQIWRTWSGPRIRSVETRAWLAVVFLLPYYGAEAYGLSAVGDYALAEADAGPLAIADGFRLAPLEVTTFLIGLVLLGWVGFDLARGLRRATPWLRAGGSLAAVGLLTYLPQFFGSPQLRVAHGVVLGAGLVVIAIATMREPAGPLTPAVEQSLPH